MIGTLSRAGSRSRGARAARPSGALAIAVAYGNRRRQFELPDGSGEVVLLDYQAHQRKLLPALATTYALSFAQDELVAALREPSADLEGRRARRRRAPAAGARDPSRPALKADRHLARHRDHPGLP